MKKREVTGRLLDAVDAVDTCFLWEGNTLLPAASDIVVEMESWIESSEPGAPTLRLEVAFASENPGLMALNEPARL
ncbi:hypothetical protein [Nocardioides lijunqiniae]|uniref:hypothetical protein n=1 Tax=Nocardioides lijunqiniae TaxID=2760832 RepID=UPI001877D252|nr:hypothetical protein [Nocardioides lijunqiniae]